jgi:hypothetical protein
MMPGRFPCLGWPSRNPANTWHQTGNSGASLFPWKIAQFRDGPAAVIGFGLWNGNISQVRQNRLF